ncbi:MAG: GTP-binding protein [Candidatus Lokiarchaeota archaeon]|nr:GTP-binding protein [Candidatus Harpocratesius repetitus]
MEYKGKVSVIGSEGTGKTSLILRYIKNTFTEEYITTLGADFIERSYTNRDLSQLRNNDIMTLVYWDMAGQDQYFEVTSIYCEGSLGIIIVFDVNDRSSYESLPEWAKFADQICPDAIKLIVGNKTDLEFKVSKDEISEMENSLGIPIELVSAKRELDHEQSNVINVFTKVAFSIFDRFQEIIKKNY